PEEVAARLNVGTPTLRDILEALARPGRDPREDLPAPVFKKGVLKLEDLQPSMELKGTVLNVVDFGAFVDFGLKDSGLVHISQLADEYVRDPHEVVSVGDIVKVWVMSVDKQRHRVSLTMIDPATRKPPPPRRERSADRPPRGKPGGAGAPGGPAGQASGPPQRSHVPRGKPARKPQYVKRRPPPPKSQHN